MLTLIKYGEGCENDLTKLTTNLLELKQVLKGKMPDDLILDSYSDANKPFSELWNEEGFTFIKNPIGEKRQGSQKYVLDPKDHFRLFTVLKKAERKPPNAQERETILKIQDSRCNFCNSKIFPSSQVGKNTFAKDRVRLVWDHRIPIEKSGRSCLDNYQGLCFSCNKYKWMICNICELSGNECVKCTLAFPEKFSKILPTGEDISDRSTKYTK